MALKNFFSKFMIGSLESSYGPGVMTPDPPEMESDSNSSAPTVEELSHNHHLHEYDSNQTFDVKGNVSQQPVENQEESHDTSYQSEGNHLVNGDTDKSTDANHVPYQDDVRNSHESTDKPEAGNHVEISSEPRSQEAVDEHMSIPSISKKHGDKELPTISIPVISGDDEESPVQQIDVSLQDVSIVNRPEETTKEEHKELIDIPVTEEHEDTHNDESSVLTEDVHKNGHEETVELHDIPVTEEHDETHNDESSVLTEDVHENVPEAIVELHDIPVTLDSEESHEKVDVESEVSPNQTAADVSEMLKPTEGELYDIPVTLDTEESHEKTEVENAVSPVQIVEENELSKPTDAALFDINVTHETEETREEAGIENKVSPVLAADEVSELSKPADEELIDIPVTLDTEVAHEKTAVENENSPVRAADEVTEQAKLPDEELLDIPVTLASQESEPQKEVEESAEKTQETMDDVHEIEHNELVEIPVTKDDSEAVHEEVLSSKDNVDLSHDIEQSSVEGAELHDIPVTLDEEGVSAVNPTDVVESNKPTEGIVDISLSVETPDLEIRTESQQVQQTPTFHEEDTQQSEVPEVVLTEKAAGDVNAPTSLHEEREVVDIPVTNDIDDSEASTDKVNETPALPEVQRGSTEETEQLAAPETEELKATETHPEEIASSVKEELHSIPVTLDTEEDSSHDQSEPQVESSIPQEAPVVIETTEPIADVQSSEVPLLDEHKVDEQEELVDIPVELVDEPESQTAVEVQTQAAAQETSTAEVEQHSPPIPVKEDESETQVTDEVPTTEEASTEPVSEEQTPPVNLDDSKVEDEVMKAPKQVVVVHAALPAVDNGPQEPESELSVPSEPPQTEEGVDIPVEIIDKPEEEQQLLLNVNPDSKLLSASGDRINVIGHNHQIQRPPSPELVDIPIEVEDAVASPTEATPVQSDPHEGEQNGEAAEAKHPMEDKGRTKIGSTSPSSPEPKKKKHGTFRKLFSCVRGQKD